MGRLRLLARLLVAALLCFLIAPGCGKTIGTAKGPQSASRPESKAASTPAGNSAPATATGGSGATLTVRFLSVGEADSCILEVSNAGKTFFALVDTGRSGTSGQVVSELRGMGCNEINVLVLTHPDADHTGGAVTVMDSLKVDDVWDPETDGSNSQTWQGVKATIAAQSIPTEHPHAGDRFDWDGVQTEVLNPPTGASYAETNDWSIVLLETLGSENIMLTGDVQAAAQQFMAGEDFPAVQVFKVPHHGADSGYYPPFFDKAHPADSVISVGPNSYGHPSQAVVNALSGFGAVYRTDVNGDIVVSATAGGLGVNPSAGSVASLAPAPAAAPAPAPAPAGGQFVGSVNSNVYHYPSCEWAQKIKPENRIYFSSPQDAVNHGYRPCKVCNPPSP